MEERLAHYPQGVMAKKRDEGGRNIKLMVCTWQCSFSPIYSSLLFTLGQRLIYSTNCSNVSTTLHNHQNTSQLKDTHFFYSEKVDYLFLTSLFNTLKTKEICSATSVLFYVKWWTTSIYLVCPVSTSLPGSQHSYKIMALGKTWTFKL